MPAGVASAAFGAAGFGAGAVGLGVGLGDGGGVGGAATTAAGAGAAVMVGVGDGVGVGVGEAEGLGNGDAETVATTRDAADRCGEGRGIVWDVWDGVAPWRVSPLRRSAGPGARHCRPQVEQMEQLLAITGGVESSPGAGPPGWLRSRVWR